VNTVATRAASLALLSLVALAATVGPAAARRENVPAPEPTATPIYFPMTPPTSPPGYTPTGVATMGPSLMASSVCQNDRFLAQRTVPEPQHFDVSVCGLVYAVSPGGFQIAIDGTQPIPVSGRNASGVQPGESVLVVGRYRSTPSSAEEIDATGGVSPLLPAASPTSSS
jgi:hypothetical protein